MKGLLYFICSSYFYGLFSRGGGLGGEKGRTRSELQAVGVHFFFFFCVFFFFLMKTIMYIV